MEEAGSLAEKPEFIILWETLLTPNIILNAFSRNKEKISSLVVAEKFNGAPRWIARLFKDRYQIGNPLVEEALLRSLPLHLQFLDSLLYRWSRFDGRSVTLEDPRLKNKLVARAVSQTFGSMEEEDLAGWGKLMFQPESAEQKEFLLTTIEQKIWPIYQKLYKQALHEEELRRTHARILQEDHERAMARHYDQLTMQEKKAIENYFNQLPPELQQALQQKAREMMQQKMAQFSQMMQSGKPQPIALQEKPKVSSKPSSDEPSLEAVEQKLQKLEDTLFNLEQQLNGMGESLENIKQGAGSAQQSAEAVSKGGKRRLDAAGKIASASSDIQQGAQELLNEARDFNQETEQGESQTENAVQNLPSPEQGANLNQNFGQMSEASKQLLNKVKRLMEKANQLKALSEKLKSSLGKDAVDESVVSAQNSAISKTLKQMEDSIRSIKGSNRELDRLIEQLENEVGTLQKSFSSSTQSTSSIQPSETDSSSSSEEMTQPEQTQNPNPTLKKPADVKGLAQLAEKYGSDIEPEKTQEPAESLKPLFDDKWLAALKQQEEIDLKRLTGLTPEEKEEYDQWKQPVEILIEKMTDILADGLGLPTVGLEWLTHEEEGVLRDLVEALTGGSAYGKRIEKEPKDVKITFLIDISYSMNGDRLNYAKLALFTLLEVIFELNERLEAKGFHPIEFEVGAFSDNDALILSHESSQMLDGSKKERIIYDLMKSLTVEGGTDDVNALGRSVTRLEESADRTSEGSHRILFVLTDGNLGAGKRDEIKKIVNGAKEKGVSIFPVAIGDDVSRRQVLDSYGEEQAIIPKSLKDLPREILIKFADTLEPPGQGRSWLEFLPQSILAGMVGFFALMGQFLVHSFQAVLSSADSAPTRNLTQVEGYRHFFIETVNGRSFLVYKKEGVPELRWERGMGGPETPLTKVPDVDYNEEMLLKILRNIHREGAAFSSYSADGRYLIRYGSSRELELIETTELGEKKTLARFPPQGEKPNQLEVEGETIYSNEGGIQWKGSLLPNKKYNLDIALNGEGFINVLGWIGPDPSELTLVEISKEKIITFHPQTESVFILRKGETCWEVDNILQMESEDAGSYWEGSLVELSGESGIGKGELLRAAAHLMNEEIVFVPGNEDMEIEDLTEYRGIGIEEAGVSTYTPSIVAKVRHYGGWVVFDEIHKIKPKTLNHLKAEIASRHHSWREENESGSKESVFVPDHPRARLFGTSNIRHKGYVSYGVASDQAMQRRKALLRMYFMPPNDEQKLQLEYARKAAAEFGTLEEVEPILNDMVEKLIKMAVSQRLTYLGYNAAQIGNLINIQFIERNGKREIIYPNWHKLSDPAFQPANQQGLYLKRPPSPRVIKNILRHFMLYPKDWKERPVSTIKKYFTYSADQDKNETFQRILKDLESAGIHDEPETDFYLRPDSFQVQGDRLVVQPLDASGNPLENYHPVEVVLHPDAEIRKEILPKEIKDWIQSRTNAKKVYEALQALSLGKHLIFVGEQETGKSTFAVALARLISGPKVLLKPINKQTSKRDLTYKQHIGEEGKAFQSGFLPQEVPQAMDTKGVGKILILEETPQGRPGVIGVLNEVTERGYLVHSQLPPLNAQPGFTLIHAINPPTKDFHGAAFSNEFLERHFIMEFDPLGPEEASRYIQEAARKNGRQLNPKIIGEKFINDQNESADYEGYELWSGLMGLEQYLRLKRKEDPGYLPRSPGLGTFKKFVRKLIDYYEVEQALSGKKPQEIFWEFFLETYTLEGDERKIAQWRKNLREAFKKCALWSDLGEVDAIETLLTQEEMIVEQLGVIRLPQTGLNKLDNNLAYIQENTVGNSINLKLDDIRRIASGFYGNDWESILFKEKLKRIYILKEIYQILGVVLKERPTHSPENIRLMQSIRENIQTALLIQNDWPDSVLDSEETKEQMDERFWKKLQTEDPVSDLFLYKAYAFADNEEYAFKQLQKLGERLAAIQPDSEKEKHRGLKQYRKLYRIRKALWELKEKVTGRAAVEAETLIELIETAFKDNEINLIEKADKNLVLSLKKIDQSVLPNDFLKIDVRIHPVLIQILNQFKSKQFQEIDLTQIRPLVNKKAMQLLYETVFKLSVVAEENRKVKQIEEMLESIYKMIDPIKTNRYTQRLAEVETEITRLESQVPKAVKPPGQTNKSETVDFQVVIALLKDRLLRSNNPKEQTAALKTLTGLSAYIEVDDVMKKIMTDFLENHNPELTETAPELFEAAVGLIVALEYINERIKSKVIDRLTKILYESQSIKPKTSKFKLAVKLVWAITELNINSIENKANEVCMLWEKADDIENIKLLFSLLVKMKEKINLPKLLFEKMCNTTNSEIIIFNIQQMFLLFSDSIPRGFTQTVEVFLNSDDIPLFEEAVKALVAIGKTDKIDQLRAVLAPTDVNWIDGNYLDLRISKLSIIYKALKINEEDVNQKIITELVHPSKKVRMAAINALSRLNLKGKKIDAEFMYILDADISDYQVNKAVLKAIVDRGFQIGFPDGQKKVKEKCIEILKKSQHEELKIEAMRALAISDADLNEVKDGIEVFLNSSHENLKNAAINALFKLGMTPEELKQRILETIKLHRTNGYILFNGFLELVRLVKEQEQAQIQPLSKPASNELAQLKLEKAQLLRLLELQKQLEEQEPKSENSTQPEDRAELPKEVVEERSVLIRLFNVRETIRKSKKRDAKGALTAQPLIYDSARKNLIQMTERELKKEKGTRNGLSALQLLVRLNSPENIQQVIRKFYFLSHLSKLEGKWDGVPVHWLYAAGVPAEEMKEVLKDPFYSFESFCRTALGDSLSKDVRGKLEQRLLELKDEKDRHQFWIGFVNWLIEIGVDKQAITDSLKNLLNSSIEEANIRAIHCLLALGENGEDFKARLRSLYSANKKQTELQELALKTLNEFGENPVQIFKAEPDDTEEYLEAMHNGTLQEKREAIFKLIKAQKATEEFKEALICLLERREIAPAVYEGFYLFDQPDTDEVDVMLEEDFAKIPEALKVLLKWKIPVSNYIEKVKSIKTDEPDLKALKLKALVQHYFESQADSKPDAFLSRSELIEAIGDYINNVFTPEEHAKQVIDLDLLNLELGVNTKEVFAQCLMDYFELAQDNSKKIRIIEILSDKNWINETMKQKLIQAVGSPYNSEELRIAALKALIKQGLFYKEWFSGIDFGAGNTTLEVIAIQALKNKEVLGLRGVYRETIQFLLDLLTNPATNPRVIQAATQVLIEKTVLQFMGRINDLEKCLKQRPEGDLGRLLGLQVLGEQPDPEKLLDAIKNAETHEEAMVYIRAYKETGVPIGELTEIIAEWEATGAPDELLSAYYTKKLYGLPDDLALVGYTVKLKSDNPSEQLDGIKGLIEVNAITPELKDKLLEFSNQGNRWVRFESIKALAHFKIEPEKTKTKILNLLQDVETIKMDSVLAFGRFAQRIEALLKLGPLTPEELAVLKPYLNEDSRFHLPVFKALSAYYTKRPDEKEPDQDVSLDINLEQLKKYFLTGPDDISVAALEALTAFGWKIQAQQDIERVLNLISKNSPVLKEAIQLLPKIGISKEKCHSLLVYLELDDMAELMPVILDVLPKLGFKFIEYQAPLRKIAQGMDDYPELRSLIALKKLAAHGIFDETTEVHLVDDIVTGTGNVEELTDLWIQNKGEEYVKSKLLRFLNMSQEQLADNTMDGIHGPLRGLSQISFNEDELQSIYQRLKQIFSARNTVAYLQEAKAAFQFMLANPSLHDELKRLLNQVIADETEEEVKKEAYKAHWLLPLGYEPPLDLETIYIQENADIAQIIRESETLKVDTHFQEFIEHLFIYQSDDALLAAVEAITPALFRENIQAGLVHIALNDPNKRVRNAALKKLLELGYPVQQLVKQLKSQLTDNPVYALTGIAFLKEYDPEMLLKKTPKPKISPIEMAALKEEKQKLLRVLELMEQIRNLTENKEEIEQQIIKKAIEADVPAEIAQIREALLAELFRGKHSKRFVPAIEGLLQTGIGWATPEQQEKAERRLKDAVLDGTKKEVYLPAIRALKAFGWADNAFKNAYRDHLVKLNFYESDWNALFEGLQLLQIPMTPLLQDQFEIIIKNAKLENVEEFIQIYLEQGGDKEVLKVYLITLLESWKQGARRFSVKNVLTGLKVLNEPLPELARVELYLFACESDYNLQPLAIELWLKLGYPFDEVEDVLKERCAQYTFCHYYIPTLKYIDPIPQSIIDSLLEKIDHRIFRDPLITQVLMPYVEASKLASELNSCLHAGGSFRVIGATEGFLKLGYEKDVIGKLFNKLKAKTFKTKRDGVIGLLYIWAKKSDLDETFFEQLKNWQISEAEIELMTVKKTQGIIKKAFEKPLQLKEGTVQEAYLELLKVLGKKPDEICEQIFKRILKEAEAEQFSDDSLALLDYLFPLDIDFEKMNLEFAQAYKSKKWAELLSRINIKALVKIVSFYRKKAVTQINSADDELVKLIKEKEVLLQHLGLKEASVVVSSKQNEELPSLDELNPPALTDIAI